MLQYTVYIFVPSVTPVLLTIHSPPSDGAGYGAVGRMGMTGNYSGCYANPDGLGGYGNV